MRGHGSRKSTITSRKIRSRARWPMVERILDRAELLLLAPRSGPRLQAFVDDEVREVLERPYRIIYRVSTANIEILTVKHYRQRLIDRPDDF